MKGRLGVKDTQESVREWNLKVQVVLEVVGRKMFATITKVSVALEVVERISNALSLFTHVLISSTTSLDTLLSSPGTFFLPIRTSNATRTFNVHLQKLLPCMAHTPNLNFILLPKVGVQSDFLLIVLFGCRNSSPTSSLLNIQDVHSRQ